MKITALIVNGNHSIVGFRVKGTESEFGRIGKEKIEVDLNKSYFFTRKFHNGQVIFQNGTIIEKGNFKLNDLPMILLENNGAMMPIQNSIKLTDRFVRDNENIGFSVIFGNGTTGKYSYNDVIKLAEIYKPSNFIVKSSTSGKKYIAGKSGQSIMDLPANVLGDESTNKKMKSGAKEATPVTGGERVSDVDILSLIEFVKANGGYIINLPGTSYTPVGDTVTSAGSKFKSFEIGEVADPYLDFNETKINASCKFRNPGTVLLNPPSDDGKPSFVTSSIPIYSYIWRSKTLFYNGMFNLQKVGIILPESTTDELYSKFASAMAVVPITDEKVISVVNKLINWKNSKIFEVSIENLSIISPSKWDSFILSYDNVYKYVDALANVKIALKYLRGLNKDLAEAGVYAPKPSKTVSSQFSMMTSDQLKALVDAGVDPFTGAYTESGETTKNTKKPVSDVVEINYIIDGLNPANFSYAKMVEKPEKMPDKVSELATKLQTYSDPNDTVKAVAAAIEKLSKEEHSLKEILWKHKVSMWMKASKAGVYKGEQGNWEIDTKSRMKATVYRCKLPGMNNLQLILNNVDIVK